MKKANKYILYVILTMVVCFILFVLFNPFYWGMQRMLEPKQPELYPQEVDMIKRMENELNVQVTRKFENKWFTNDPSKIDTSVIYIYSINIYSSHRNDSLGRNEVYNLKLANYIKDSILYRSKNIQNILICWEYSDQEDYKSYYFKHDTINSILIGTSGK